MKPETRQREECSKFWEKLTTFRVGECLALESALKRYSMVLLARFASNVQQTPSRLQANKNSLRNANDFTSRVRLSTLMSIRLFLLVNLRNFFRLYFHLREKYIFARVFRSHSKVFTRFLKSKLKAA